jgi:hypothetical protein
VPAGAAAFQGVCRFRAGAGAAHRRGLKGVAGSSDPLLVPDYTINASENLIGLVWHGVASMKGVDELEEAFDRVSRGCSRRIGFATRLSRESVTHGASPEVREAIGMLLRRFAPRIGATVVIYEEAGIKATFVRTIISAINMLSRAQFPSQVHSNLLQGCMWMMSALGPDAPVDGEKRLLRMLPNQPPTTAAPPRVARAP